MKELRKTHLLPKETFAGERYKCTHTQIHTHTETHDTIKSESHWLLIETLEY